MRLFGKSKEEKEAEYKEKIKLTLAVIDDIENSGMKLVGPLLPLIIELKMIGQETWDDKTKIKRSLDLIYDFKRTGYVLFGNYKSMMEEIKDNLYGLKGYEYAKKCVNKCGNFAAEGSKYCKDCGYKTVDKNRYHEIRNAFGGSNVYGMKSAFTLPKSLDIQTGISYDYTAYDVKAKKNVKIHNPKVVKLKNGRWAIKGTSPLTGNTIFRIAGTEKPKL